MSEFIEKSKHPEMTRVVHEHIMGAPPANSLPPAGHQMPMGDAGIGDDSGVGYAKPSEAGHHTP